MSELMGTVDYRMARTALLREVKTGRVSRFDVCDAHPELLRAAKHVGQETSDICPICTETQLRIVLYTYGKGLKRRNGTVSRAQDLRDLRRQIDEFTCYVVEVCTDCNWNHLVRSFVTGRRHAG